MTTDQGPTECAGSVVRIRTQGILAVMTRAIRRWMLGIGAALLIGGWGMTRYAHEQQQLELDGQDSSFLMWIHGPPGKPGTSHMPSKSIFGRGVIAMALGAGLIGFAIPRRCDRSGVGTRP